MEKQLAEVIARLKGIMDEQERIEKDAALNNEGAFSDDQQKQYEALDAMSKEFEIKKAAIEKQMELVQARKDREDLVKPRILTRRTSPNSGAPITTRVIGNPVDVSEDEDDEGERQVRFTIPVNVKRITPTNFRGERNGMSAEKRAYRFGMWALANIARSMPRYNFDHAQEFVKNYMRPMNVAHGETELTTGGHFLVPEEFSSDLIDLREQYGVARRLFRRVPMASDTMNIPKRTGGVTAYFTAENAAATESNMTWGNVKLVAKKLTALSRMSNELSADAVISVGDTLAFEIGYAFAYTEDLCAFNGDGSDTYGGINGVRTLLDSIDGADTDSAGLVAQGTGSTWAAIVLGDFNNVLGKLPEYAANDNVCWVTHRTFYYSVMQKLQAAAGGNDIASLAAGDPRPRPMFLGYPVEFSQVFPSATASSSVVCALGDFSQGAILGDRSQTGISFSDQGTIGGESLFERGQIGIRGEERIDINVHGCGTASVVGPIVGLTTG